MLQLGFGPVPECSRDFNIRSIHLGGGDSNNTNAPLNNIPLSLTASCTTQRDTREKKCCSKLELIPLALPPLDIVTMSTRTNNTQKTRVSKTNITKLPNRSKLKTPTNEGARKIAYHEGIWRLILVPDGI